MVRGHIACRTFVVHGGIHVAWRLLAAVRAIVAGHADRVGAGERVPDGGAAAVLAVGALHLVGCGAHAPDEAVGEGAVVIVGGGVDPIGVRGGPLGGALLQPRTGRADLVAEDGEELRLREPSAGCRPRPQGRDNVVRRALLVAARGPGAAATQA